MWQYHPLLFVLQLGVLISVGVAGYCVYRIRRHGYSLVVASVGLLAALNAVYNAAAAMKTASPTLSAKLWWYKLEVLGSAVNPSVALVLALAYLGYKRWLTRPVLAVLVGIPAVAVPLIIANPGSVMIVNPVLVPVDGLVALEHEFPPLFVAYLAWAHGAFLSATLLVAYSALVGTARRTPALLISTGMFLPISANLLKILEVYPPGGDGFNVTPAFATATLALVALAIGRYRLFDLLPVGRTQAFDVMDDGYVLTDATGQIVDANAAARTLLDEEHLVSRPLSAVLPVFDDLDDASDAFTATVQDRVLQVRSSDLRDGAELAGRVLMLRDITPLREREQALERENERLDRFVGVVSHDLRNPLNVATGRLELAQDDLENEHLEAIDRSLERMRRLVDDLLVLARQGASVDADDTAPVALNDAVQTCWQHVDTAQARLRIETTQVLSAAEGRLQQLLENLIRNAVEHGGADVTITIGELDDGFYVADDGAGLSDADRDRLFDSGYSTDPDGTGFGLSIVREIADAHGWTVAVGESASGGARFDIRGIDRADEAEASDAASHRGDGTASSSSASSAAAVDNGNGATQSASPKEEPDAAPDDRTTVLVVDDNVDVRRYVSDLLAPSYAVIKAADGERGLDRARSALPDLIVSDVMMPNRNGFSMLRALRRDRRTACIPVVLLTARAEATAHVEGMEEGGDAYLTKPVDGDVLGATVNRLLAARQRLREQFRHQAESSSSPEPDASEDSHSSFEERVRGIVRAHFSDPDFSVADLADEMALSRSHLTNKVKEELGQPPSALLRSMRLEKGAELLAAETGTVTEVAYAVGFNSLSYFSRCFKDEYGVPPSSYRAERA